MYKDYAIQNVVVVEMKVKEGALINQFRESNNIVNNMKTTFKETYHKSKTWEEDMLRIDTTVTLE